MDGMDGSIRMNYVQYSLNAEKETEP